MNKKIFSENAGPKLSLLETEEAIFYTKQYFQKALAEALDLYRVSGPLFVPVESGVQDNLNGIEKAVSFKVPLFCTESFEVVHSLAKWKRFALKKYNVPLGKGIYTEMNALRPDEESLSSTHSIFVDQWDWEKVINPEERNLQYLKQTVKKIYQAIKHSEIEICARYGFSPILPTEITFLHTEELQQSYPHLSPREREKMACQEHKAIFLIGIGGILADGKIHDGRAPDYDDWSTPSQEGKLGLNGDIIVWNPILENAFELSSMGIRVDKKALNHQLKIRNCIDRLELPWHQLLTNGELPESIGGGIGQSRLCMLFLRKEHIGQVQASWWPNDQMSHSLSSPQTASTLNDFPILHDALQSAG